MTLGALVLRSLRHRRLATALSALSVALGVGLVLGIDTLRREARDHFQNAAVSWDLVVGPKASPLQIVLYTVFQMDEAPGTIPVSAYERLRKDPRVRTALPWVVGDSYRGFRIVGTSGDLFGQEVRSGAVVRCESGTAFRPFDSANPAWEAVLGSTVAAETGLRVGEEFHATHGLDAGRPGEEHEEAPWKVAGILAPTGTPVDRAVWIPWESFFAMEGHDPAAGRGEGAERRISAVVLRAANPALANLLFFELRGSPDLQPARPFVEVRRLFDLVGNADRLLLAVAALVVVVAAIGILVSMTSGMRERRRDLAMMRALGAPRRTLAALMVAEAGTVGLFGAAGGLLLGHGIVAAGASALSGWSGVRIRTLSFAPEEILVLAGAVGLCALAGVLPAVLAYRADVASGLAPES